MITHGEMWIYRGGNMESKIKVEPIIELPEREVFAEPREIYPQPQFNWGTQHG